MEGQNIVLPLLDFAKRDGCHSWPPESTAPVDHDCIHWKLCGRKNSICMYVCTIGTAVCQLSTTSLAEQLSYFLSIVLTGAASELQKHTIYDASMYAFVTPAEWLCYPKWGQEPPFGNHCSSHSRYGPKYLLQQSCRFSCWWTASCCVRKKVFLRNCLNCENQRTSKIHPFYNFGTAGINASFIYIFFYCQGH